MYHEDNGYLQSLAELPGIIFIRTALIQRKPAPGGHSSQIENVSFQIPDSGNVRLNIQLARKGQQQDQQ